MNFGRQITFGVMIGAIVREDMANPRYEKPYSQLPIPKLTPEIFAKKEDLTLELPSRYFPPRPKHNWKEVRHKSMTPAPLRKIWIYRQ